MSELSRNEAAPPGLPPLWLLQRARSDRYVGLKRPDSSGGCLFPPVGAQMTTIAVDAMGGDHAPRPEVEGAVLAARELGVRVLLVGQTEVVKRELARHPHRGLPIELAPASEVISMNDHPAQAFRRKKD